MARWVQSENAIHCAMRPPSDVIISCLTLSDLRLQLVPIKREEDDLELRVQLPKKFVLLQRHVVS